MSVKSKMVAFIVNWTQPKVTWEEQTSSEELSRSDWSVAMSVRDFLD